MPHKKCENQNIISHHLQTQSSQKFQFKVNPNSINHINFPIQLDFQFYQPHRFFDKLNLIGAQFMFQLINGSGSRFVHIPTSRPMTKHTSL